MRRQCAIARERGGGGHARGAPGELEREIHRGEEAARIRVARLRRVGREIERGAVVDRRADERQPERHVDALAEARGLEHGQALVVVHRDDRVEAARDPGHEHRVGGQRAGHVVARGAQRGDRRRDHVDLLAAEVPALAGVRVEPADGDARRGEREPGGELGGDDRERRVDGLRA